MKRGQDSTVAQWMTRWLSRQRGNRVRAQVQVLTGDSGHLGAENLVAFSILDEDHGPKIIEVHMRIESDGTWGAIRDEK
jgi:hypothetical protein